MRPGASIHPTTPSTREDPAPPATAAAGRPGGRRRTRASAACEPYRAAAGRAGQARTGYGARVLPRRPVHDRHRQHVRVLRPAHGIALRADRREHAGAPQSIQANRWQNAVAFVGPLPPMHSQDGPLPPSGPKCGPASRRPHVMVAPCWQYRHGRSDAGVHAIPVLMLSDGQAAHVPASQSQLQVLPLSVHAGSCEHDALALSEPLQQTTASATRIGPTFTTSKTHPRPVPASPRAATLRSSFASP